MSFSSWNIHEFKFDVIIKFLVKIAVNKRVINNLNNYSIYPLASQLITHRLYRYNHLGFHPPNRHEGKYVLNVPHGISISLWLWFSLFSVPASMNIFFERRLWSIRNVTKNASKIPMNFTNCFNQNEIYDEKSLINLTFQPRADC